MLRVNLSYNDKYPYHKDITLVVSGLVNDTQDTYFLALDNFVLPNEESWKKVKTVFFIILNKWQDSIRDISKNTVIYLPFDFSDQYIGCLKLVGLSNDQVSIQYGFTTLFTGTTLCPSQIDLFKLKSEEFNVSSRFPNLIEVDKNELIQDIEIEKYNVKSL